MSSDAAKPPAFDELAAGAVIGEKYALVEVIGEGGMGRVWRARHLGDGRELALKLVGLGAREDARWRRRFEREAKLLARLGELSPHIVRIEDYDFDAAVGPFLAMELLTGSTLAVRLADGARLPARMVVRIVDELCNALAISHREGVVHRDVKPANLFLHRPGADDEIVKLLDFGVAKVRVDSEMTMPTREGTMLGTPQYMSPEQFLGDTTLDARSDLWSVGVVAYRMLVGHSPFSRGPATELAARILGHDPAPPSSWVAGLPRPVDAWIERALAKRPADRFPDATTMAAELSKAFEGMRPSRVPPANRRAKGVNLIELVKLLRNERKAGRLGELTAEEHEMLEERILVSTWYPIEHFWRLLRLAHERVLWGSEERTIELGRAGARRVMSSVHSVFVQHEDLERGIKSFARGWATYFDFGTVNAELDGDVVSIAIHGYPDMPRAHGLSTLGWYEVGLRMLGFDARSGRLVSGPWSGDEDVVFEYRR